MCSLTALLFAVAPRSILGPMRRWLVVLVAAALVVGAAATASAQEAGPPPGAEAAPRVVRTIGTPGSGDGQLFLPQQVDLLADGTVLVGQGLSGNGTPRFQLFEQDGTPLGTPTLPSATRWDVDTNGEFVSLDDAAAGIAAHAGFPVSFEVGPDGLLYVADFDGGQVVVLTTSGAHVRTFGDAPGADLTDPRSIAFGPAGEVVVADSWKCKIFVFSATGTLLRKWGGCGALAVAPNGDVVASGSGAMGLVRRFRADGRMFEELRLTSTGDVAVDGQGQAFVVDPLAHDVKVIKPGDGVLVDARIRRGTGPLVGNGIYSTADLAGGNTQHPSLAIVRPGQTVTFTVSMKNAGLDTDRLKITGLGSISNVDVRYYRNGVDVTSRVVGGTYVTGPIPIDGTHDLTVKITPRGSTFGSFVRKITVSSMTRASAKDSVLAMVSSS